jgi:hypothetical protein
MLGTVTRQNICHPLAPRLMAAVSSSAPIASMTGISSRATKGKRHERGGEDAGRG